MRSATTPPMGPKMKRGANSKKPMSPRKKARMGQLPHQPILDDEMYVFTGFSREVADGEQSKVAIAQCRGKSHFAGSTPSAWPGVAVSGGVAGALSLPAGKCSIGAPTEPGRVSGDVGGSIGAGRLRSWHVLTRNISIATELTTDASVKNGVQKAFQRARRRSSLSSSRFLGDGGFIDP